MLPDWVKEALEREKEMKVHRAYAQVGSQERLDAVLYGILMMITKNIDG